MLPIRTSYNATESLVTSDLLWAVVPWAERTTPSVLSWSVGADVRNMRRRSLWDDHQVPRLLLLLTATDLEALDANDI